jgi:hypothetical protein
VARRGRADELGNGAEILGDDAHCRLGEDPEDILPQRHLSGISAGAKYGERPSWGRTKVR